MCLKRRNNLALSSKIKAQTIQTKTLPQEKGERNSAFVNRGHQNLQRNVFLVEALTFLYLLYQVKDEGLVDNEKNEDEETPQEAENEDSIIGAVETI